MQPQPPIPENFARTLVSLRGTGIRPWLDRLPALLAGVCEEWSLSPERRPFPGLSYNFVLPVARGDGAPAVLKLSPPGDKGFRTEAAALVLFDGRGACRLMELDLERGAMLLERLRPGAPLSAVADDEEATALAAGVMGKIRRPPPPGHGFPTVSGWARGFGRLRRRFGGGTGPMPRGLVEEAEAHFADLLASEGEPFLLHGDLHHENVLSASREPWLAVDPKGVVGEAAYEAAALLHNPARTLDAPDPGRLLRRRIEVLAAEADLDGARVGAWGLAQAVLAAYWSLEDGGRVWEEALAFARLLQEVRA